MLVFEIKILSASIKTPIKSLKCEAVEPDAAALIAAAKVFGSPFDAGDFGVLGITGFVAKYKKITHRRIAAFWCFVEIGLPDVIFAPSPLPLSLQELIDSSDYVNYTNEFFGFFR